MRVKPHLLGPHRLPEGRASPLREFSWGPAGPDLPCSVACIPKASTIFGLMLGYPLRPQAWGSCNFGRPILVLGGGLRRGPRGRPLRRTSTASHSVQQGLPGPPRASPSLQGLQTRQDLPSLRPFLTKKANAQGLMVLRQPCPPHPPGGPIAVPYLATMSFHFCFALVSGCHMRGGPLYPSTPLEPLLAHANVTLQPV